ncbi:TRAP transporter small permease subunit [Piscinibacter sakaiensis]|uniref:TRAP transporter small permease protein n=1 Tax=Piscinibacter sakaiensis TaxID=1547922 RepID=A0A0K8NY40_PISS1|nr:TRAP transporter small permease subunit [Piscinibacter sakaiensis]GAP35199.1 TRAP-type transport system, small permease component, putative N-acetylneuraminate transporter [Piscinibacter sakaiensis]
MKRLIGLAERWVLAIGILAALLLVPLVLATTWEVVARYAFGAPTIWAYEVGYTLTGSHFLLALAYTLRQGEHIRIDVLSGSLPPGARRAIDALVYALVLPILLWLTWTLWGYASSGYARGETSGQSALNLPVWPFRLVFTLAFATFALQVLCELAKTLVPGARPGERTPA